MGSTCKKVWVTQREVGRTLFAKATNLKKRRKLSGLFVYVIDVESRELFTVHTRSRLRFNHPLATFILFISVDQYESWSTPLPLLQFFSSFHLFLSGQGQQSIANSPIR